MWIDGRWPAGAHQLTALSDNLGLVKVMSSTQRDDSVSGFLNLCEGVGNFVVFPLGQTSSRMRRIRWWSPVISKPVSSAMTS